MKMKDNKIGTVLKTESKVIAYVVICLVIIVLGISYALFFEVKGNEKNQIVKAGTLEFTYANGSQITNETNSDCFIPMSEEEALKHSECEYKISITNAGTLPGNYNINLTSESGEKPLELSKLKVILKKEGQVVANYPKDGTTTSLVTNEKIEAGSVINYSVQIYVDAENELLNADDDEKNISLKINGDAVVNEEELNPSIPLPTATNFIKNLAKTDTTNLMADDTSNVNIRYVGASPNNYIDIGDGTYDSDLYFGYDSSKTSYMEFNSLNECQNHSSYNNDCTLIHSAGDKILWRVIGVMNNITNLDNGGQQESLVKIIRDESIGDYSWDSSSTKINLGQGVNEWSQADVMKLLNPNTVYSETPAIGGSLYWNRGSGSCYNRSSEKNITCDFTSSGLSEEAKNKIVKVRWNTGTFESTLNSGDGTASETYEIERGSHNGKEYCERGGGGYYCNDEVPRTTTWDGYIGLIYQSDFGYAVGGEVRETCLGKILFLYNSDSCNTNNWLTPSSDIWTITPAPNSDGAYNAYYLLSSGYSNITYVNNAYGVQPVAYLQSSVKIAENPQPNKIYGSQENPFVAR